MHLTFTFPANSNRQLELHHPEKFSGTELKEYFHSVKGAGGKYSVMETVFEGASLCTTVVDSKAPCTLNVKCSRFCWLMNFVLEGTVKFNLGEITDVCCGRQLTYHSLSLNADMAFDNAAKIFTLCLTREFVSKFLNPLLLQKPLAVHTKGITDPRTRAIITSLQEPAVADNSRRIFLELKVLELLSIHLESVSPKKDVARGLSKQDVERLQEAKTILTRNLQAPCSLIELARRTGLNDFKLKKGFKLLFGNTVFGYLFQLRMEMAYNLLQNSKNVSEVAEAIGYKNPHHFTAAFKKKYGFLPSQLNKMSA